MANRQPVVPDLIRCAGYDHDSAVDAIVDCRVQRDPGAGAVNLFRISPDLCICPIDLWAIVRPVWQAAYSTGRIGDRSLRVFAGHRLA